MWIRCIAHTCRGRVLASRAEYAKAVAAFEAGAGIAQQHEFWMLEAEALRDLILHALRPAGLGSDEVRARGRLATALRCMRSNGGATGLGQQFPGIEGLGLD